MADLYHVYVIQSSNGKSLYFGYTSDLEQRLIDHNAGRNASTAKGKPWRVVYCESYRSEKDARDREQKLKHHGNARTYIKRRIADSLS